ncbi:P-loop containing nucleoside triphosphate hydrolase protein [Apiospora arundinis]
MASALPALMLYQGTNASAMEFNTKRQDGQIITRSGSKPPIQNNEAPPGQPLGPCDSIGTGELCNQIATVLEKLLRCAPWIVSTTVGGESKKLEKAPIRKAVNIIATPGRLTDHLDPPKPWTSARVTASKSNSGAAEVNNDSVFSAPAQLKQPYIITAAKP